MIAFLNIDEVIKIIRENDEPKPVLMSHFGISERQAEAILELKLRHLAKLEEMKIRGELAELEKERDYLARYFRFREKADQTDSRRVACGCSKNMVMTAKPDSVSVEKPKP